MARRSEPAAARFSLVTALMLGSNETTRVSRETRGVVAITSARADRHRVALAGPSGFHRRQPQIERFALFRCGPCGQKQRAPMREARARSGHSSSFALERSTRDSVGIAFKNETSPQNAPALTASGRSRSHLLKSRRLGRGAAARATREHERGPRRSLPKLLATTNGSLHDYGSRQQRDADHQSDRDPKSSSATSAPGLNEAEFKRIYGTMTRSSREVLRANHHQ